MVLYIYSSEVHSEPRETSKMEPFCKNSKWLKAINFFGKKVPFYMFMRVLNLSGVLNMICYDIVWRCIWNHAKHQGWSFIAKITNLVETSSYKL